MLVQKPQELQNWLEGVHRSSHMQGLSLEQRRVHLRIWFLSINIIFIIMGKFHDFGKI